MASPKIIPVQGKSDSPGAGDLIRCMKSSGTSLQYLLSLLRSIKLFGDTKVLFWALAL